MINKRNIIVTLADKNYIRQAKQLFSCVYWNAGWDGDYMLLAHEIPEKDLKWFRDKGILIKECSTLYDGPMGDGNYSASVIDKFYLFTKEFKKWGHVVFLDSDIIVRSSIAKMTKTKAFSSPQINKRNFKAHFFKIDCKEREMVEKEYNLKRSAFNSGVFSFNTDIIKEDTFTKIMSVFNKYACISNGDDSILNLFFYDQWVKIPLVYNVQVNYTGLKKYKGIVLHFQRHSHYAPLWDPQNSYYNEWKTNLEKAEFIDLSKVQLVGEWSVFKIKYYSLFLNVFLFKVKTVNKSKFYAYKIRYFILYKLRPFIRYKLTPFFLYILMTPDRHIGKLGNYLKYHNPDLYHKLRRIKSGKQEKFTCHFS